MRRFRTRDPILLRTSRYTPFIFLSHPHFRNSSDFFLFLWIWIRIRFFLLHLDQSIPFISKFDFSFWGSVFCRCMQVCSIFHLFFMNLQMILSLQPEIR
ncbi:hypothetical protein JHK85_033717 [Glycine max]|uniref:Uncharacterized protein n=1 Tax=Glycine max TaxID=3847 RepID=K7LTE6_SOYBN|nr:hypothetical protein JHK85_033717 [Glycine max]KAG4985410.1 hypothetical protein JHK86_033101 [Glycine max]KAH1141974.1 hypothetical protein GYH30_032931 [Glycine max]